MNSDQKAILGFILGVTAGALAGILLAPNSGEETRRKLSDTTGSWKDNLGKELTNAFNKLKSYADNVAEDGRDAVRDVETRTRRAANQAQNM